MKNEKKFLWIALCVVLLSSASWAQKYVNNLELRMGGENAYKKISSGYTVVKKGDDPADLQEDAKIGKYLYMGYTKTDSVKRFTGDAFNAPITNIIVRDLGTSTYSEDFIDTLGFRYHRLTIYNESGTVQYGIDISNNKWSNHHLHIYYTMDDIDGKTITAVKVASSKNASGNSGFEAVSNMDLNLGSTNSSKPKVYLMVKREAIPRVSFTTIPHLYNASSSSSDYYLTYTGFAQNLIKLGEYDTYEASAYYKKKNGEWRVWSPTGINAGTYQVYYKLESNSRLKADLISDEGVAIIHKMPADDYRYYYSYTLKNQLGTEELFGGDLVKLDWDDKCNSGDAKFFMDNGRSFLGTVGTNLSAGSYKINKIVVPESYNCESRTLTPSIDVIVNKSKIVFNTNGGTPVAAVEGDIGDAVTAPADPTREGYVFRTWYPSIPSKISRGITIVNAYWDKLYTITFDTDGGSSIASISGVQGSAVTAPKKPTKKDYTFLGWDKQIPTTMPSQDMTIKALWEYNRVEVNLPEAMEIVTGDVAEDKFFIKGSKATIRVKSGYAITSELTYNGKVIDPVDGIYTFTVAEIDASVEADFIEDYGAIQVALDHSVAYIDRKSTAFTNVPNAIDVDAVEFVQKFTRGVTTTIVLPFSVDMAYVNGGIFCKFIGVGGSGNNLSVRLMFVSTQLEANTPYVYVPIKDKLTFDVPAGTKFSIKTEETAVEFGNWQFKSIYSLRNWRTGEGDHGRAYAFIASKDGSDGVAGKFQKIGNNNSMPPMRGYLVYETAPQAIRSAFDGAKYEPAVVATLPDEIGVEIVSEEDKTLAVGKINMVTGELKIDRWFDVTGKLLKGKPTTKGAYYHNGKKVIIK